MKIKTVSFILSQIKTLLAIILVASVTMLIIWKYSYKERVKINSIFVTEPNKTSNEHMDRLKRTGILYNDDSLKNAQKDDIKPAVEELFKSKKTYSKLTKSGAKGSKFKSSQEKDFEIKISKESDSWLKQFRQSHSGEKCVKRLPQAIIVGIQKSGTTALNHFLSEHPQIKACLQPAETQYFSGHYNRPLSWYRNLMPCSYSNQITIEKSPPYFYRRFCAERIRRMNPKTKIIIIVKDPITRTQSMYAMLKAHSNGRIRPFEDLVSMKSRSIINGNSRLIDFSNYPKYMGAWLHYFNLKQILFVDGHNLEENPAQELNKVENFLGIHTYFTADKFIFNKTKGKYCSKSNSSGSGMECLNEKKGRPHEEISKPMRHKLEAYFGPKNKKFFSMIKQRFNWGY